MAKRVHVAPVLRVGSAIDPDMRHIRYAEPADVHYVYDLAARFTKMVGFVCRGAIAERVDTRRIILVEENGQPAGFVSLTHRVDQTTHLPQIAVEEELWRTHVGTSLMHVLINSATDAGSLAITLRSALDLHANFFWPQFGFLPQGNIAGRKRVLACWAKPLSDQVAFPIFAQPRGAHASQFILNPPGVNAAKLPPVLRTTP